MMIRGLALLLLVLPCACQPSMDLGLSKVFQEAQERVNTARTTEDFLQTAHLYEQILDAGVINGAVLYNLGNAYMQADERGRAIAAYRQAKRYRPRDPFLDANLAYALGGDSVPDENQSVVDYVLFWKNWISYPEKFHLTLAAAGVSLFLAIIALYAKRRKPWKRLTWVALLVTLLLTASSAFELYRFDFIKHGVVTDDQVVARKGNAESFEPAFTEPLPEGTEFKVKDQRNHWLLIHLKTGLEAWIPQNQAVIF